MSNKMVTAAGKTHVVWLDQIHKTYVRTLNRKTGRWTQPVFVGDGDDNHAGAAMTMDSGGYLHLVFGPHHNPLQHVVSAKPHDTHRWIAQPTFGGVNATYPSLVCDRDDTLHACYRGAFERERPWGVMYQKRPKGGEWTAPVKLVDPEGPPAYTHFANILHLGGDGTLYVGFHIVRATEEDRSDTKGRGFGMMRSRNYGETWETVSGERLDLPEKPDSPCIIEFDEAINVRMGNLACVGGSPFFTLNRREGEVPETSLYRWRKGAWQVTPLLPEVRKLYDGCEMSDVGALCVSDGGVLYIAAVVCEPGGTWWDRTNEIVLLTSHDLGQSFTGYKVSPEDATWQSWLPSLERQTGHNGVRVPHLLYTFGDQGVGCSPDVDTEIRCVSLSHVAREENRQIVERMAAADSLSGVCFTDEQRRAGAAATGRLLRQYEGLRELEIGYDVAPPVDFVPGPVPAAPGECRPFRLSRGGVPELPATEQELAFSPVPDLARWIESKQISPVELTRLYLDRLTRYGDALRCVVTLTEDLALAEAEKAEGEIAKGQYRGPLHGIPWGAKDLLATKGIPTTWGATPFKEQVIDTDATVVERLREAGAVLVAKLSLGALAQGPHWFGGMTRNPWKPESGSSGSSAGPGSATAAGLVGFSIGSETQGSIVSPSHTCGVVGLRPTYGRVSRYGAMALSWTMDKLGPMCRGVEDCAAVLDAIYGPDGRDTSVADAFFEWRPEVSLSGLRVGYLASEFEETRLPGERAVDAGALEVLGTLGAKLEPVELPDYPLWGIGLVLCVEGAAAFDDATRSGELEVMHKADKSNWPETFRSHRMVSAVEYLRAQRARALLMRDMAALMDAWDVLIAPGMGRASLGLTNLTGHPAVIVPCGFVDGMPRGITLIGKLYDEATILAVARAYEQATEWHTVHPDLSAVEELEEEKQEA